jgi:hypothetical protein
LTTSAAAFKQAGALDQLVDLEWDEQAGGDHGEVLGPAPAAPQPDALDDLQDPVAE